MNQYKLSKRLNARHHFKSLLILGLMAGSASAQLPLSPPLMHSEPLPTATCLTSTTTSGQCLPAANVACSGLSQEAVDTQACAPVPRSATWSLRQHTTWLLGLQPKPRTNGSAETQVLVAPAFPSQSQPALVQPASVQPTLVQPASDQPALLASVPTLVPRLVPTLVPSLVPTSVSTAEQTAVQASLATKLPLPMQSMVVQAQFAEAKDLPEVPDHVRAGKKSADHAQPMLGSSSFVAHAYQADAPRADNAPVIAGPVPALPLEQAPPESLLDVDIYGTGSGTGVPASTDDDVAANEVADENQPGSLIDGLDFMPFTALGLSDRADSNHRAKSERSRATRSNASASIGDTDPPAQVAIHESFAPRTKAGSSSFQMSDDAGSNSIDQSNEYAFSDQDNTDNQDVGPDNSGLSAEPAYPLAQSTLSDAEPIGLPDASNHSRADEQTNTNQGPLLVKTEAFSVPALPSVPTAVSTPTALNIPPELPEPLANRSNNTQRPMSLSVGAAEQGTPGLLAASPATLPATDSAASTSTDAVDSTTQPAVPTVRNTAPNDKAANNPAASRASVAGSLADKTTVDETSSPSDANKPSLQPVAQPVASEKRSLSDVNPIALNRPIVKAVKPSAVSNPAADSQMAPVILPSSFEDDGSLVAGESFARLAAKMHALVKQKYPESRITVKSDEEGLIVQGVAASEAEASKILSFVRKTSLCPVADRVSTTR